MKLRVILGAGALAFTAFATNPAFAQMTMDHAKMGMAVAPGMTDGEVRKIDKDAGKITIKHGEIKHMEMSGMTMVFVVKDKGFGGVLSGDGNRAFGCVEGSKDRHFLLVHQSNHFLGGHAV